MAQRGVTEEERREKEKRVWADVDEGLKFVNQKGKVMCKYCSKPEGTLKVTSNDISLQDLPYMTNADKDGKVNLVFEGTCNHPSQQKPFCPPPPCKSVINLSEWKAYSDVHINNDFALIVNSTIPCLISGEDITITHSGQMAEATELEPLPKKITDAYWMEEGGREKFYIDFPEYKITLYLKTRGYEEGETVEVKILSPEGRLFKGNKTELIVTGSVDAKGMVVLENFEINYELNNRIYES